MKKGSLIRAKNDGIGLAVVHERDGDSLWVQWLNGHMKDLGINGPFPLYMFEEVSK